MAITVVNSRNYQQLRNLSIAANNKTASLIVDCSIAMKRGITEGVQLLSVDNSSLVFINLPLC